MFSDIDRQGFANFVPGESYIRSLLNTRKNQINIQGMSINPLFGCDNFSLDNMMVLIVVILEFSGIFMMAKDLPVVYALPGAIGILIVDVVLAILMHICKHRNSDLCRAALPLIENGLLLVEGYSEERKKAAIEATEKFLSKWNFISNIFAVTIILMAIGKIVAYLMLSGFQIDTMAFLIMVSYLVVAMIHIFYTGYWWFGLVAKFKWNNALSTYKLNALNHSSEGKLLETPDEFEVPKNTIPTPPPSMKLEGTSTVIHEIVKVDETMIQEKIKEGYELYKLICRGVMLNNDIPKMLNGISTKFGETRRKIVLQCLMGQFTFMSSAVKFNAPWEKIQR